MKKIGSFLTVVLTAVCLSACTGVPDGGTGVGERAEVSGAGEAGVTDMADGPADGSTAGSPAGAETVGERVSESVSAQQGRYCHDALDADGQRLYEDMYAIMAGMHTDAALSVQDGREMGEQEIDKIFQCVMNDHPELFYVTGYTYTRYTYGGRTSRISFSGTYTMDMEERDRRQALIDAAVEECLSGIGMEASDYEKVKYVYEYLILHTDYNQDAVDDQNICSVFIGGESVCQGYAKATQYLLEKLQVDAVLVNGSVYGGESHAWNLVRIDGAYYYVDTTWGDASYRIAETADGDSAYARPSINYDYLCVTTEELLDTHRIDNVVPLPECTASDANYYVMEGAYFTAYDEAGLAALFEKGYDEDRTDVTIKCSEKEVYDIFCEQLVAGQRIFEYLNSPDGVVAYVKDEDRLSLTFWLVNE